MLKSITPRRKEHRLINTRRNKRATKYRHLSIGRTNSDNSPTIVIFFFLFYKYLYFFHPTSSRFAACNFFLPLFAVLQIPKIIRWPVGNGIELSALMPQSKCLIVTYILQGLSGHPEKSFADIWLWSCVRSTGPGVWHYILTYSALYCG